MRAKAAVFMGANKPFSVKEFEVTKPPQGYAQMELIASGICGTDIHIHNGKLGTGAPSIIGHEFVGRIMDMNEDEGAKYGLKIGDAVIADILPPFLRYWRVLKSAKTFISFLRSLSSSAIFRASLSRSISRIAC